MKIRIIGLLEMIANGEQPPKKIYYLEETFIYDEQSKDYYDSETYGLFDRYEIPPILNDEVEILETTITYKPDKIEKLKIITKKTECDHNHHYLVNGKIEYRLREVDKIILDKINEIIDRVNKL